MTLRVLLADDHEMMREGLRSLLDGRDKYEVVEATDGRDAVRLAGEHDPDVIVMDVAMPGMDGIVATRKILSTKSDAKIIALSLHSDEFHVRKMIEAGASGYVPKDCAFQELEKAITVVLEDGIYLSPNIERVEKKHVLSGQNPADRPDLPITARQREVITLLALDCTSQEIADTLQISVAAVAKHRQRAMKKLGAVGMAKLTKYAIRAGLTSLD
jgi:DNA-binding NarL/FixJ family response regulator